MREWEEGWDVIFATLDSLRPEDVTRTITIRQEPHTVLQACNRALAHYAQHVGQIVFLAKHLRSHEWKTLSMRTHAFLMRVLDDLDVRYGDQALVYNFVEEGQRLAYFLFCIHHRDHDRAVRGSREQVWTADESTGAVTFYSAIYGCTRRCPVRGIFRRWPCTTAYL